MNNFNYDKKDKTNKIALFASGSGTNAENIANYFQKRKGTTIALILTNKNDAFVIQRAKRLNIPFLVFGKDDFYKTRKILNILLENNIDLIVLAGFLWLIPENIIHSFNKRKRNVWRPCT